MNLNTPEGVLTIDDDKLTFAPVDDGPVLTVSLSPMPDFHYERGIYGSGSLVVGEHVITLDNERASAAIEELRRPRGNVKAARKFEHRGDSDTATAK